jgi:hypothetical protein
MQAGRGICVKPLAAALAFALGAGSMAADAGTPGNPAQTARMQALHNAVAQLQNYRAEHPAKLRLFPSAHPHKIKFPRHPNAPTTTAATVAVSSCVDNASSATTAGTLRYAVLNAVDGDTIDLSACNASTITLSQGALPVSVDNLTITAGAGNHVTIDGGGADRVIYAKGPGTTAPYVLALRYLTLQNGNSPIAGAPIYAAAGGCVFSQYGGVGLYHSTVTGCTAANPTGPAEGGGVAALGLYMYQSSITRNTVSTGNGAPPSGSGAPPIAIGGGAIAKYNPYIVNSHIDGNTATSTSGLAASGGGLVAVGAYLKGSTVSNNSVQVSAGSTTGGTPYLGIAGGLAAKYGGTLQASTISGNKVTCTSGSTSYPNALCIGGGVSTAYSGGSASASRLEIYYSTISGNASACSVAGAACIGGGIQSKYALKLVQSTISGNSAQAGAGIVQKYFGVEGAYIYNSTIAANTAQYVGAGLYAYAGGPSSTPSPITLVSSIVAKNTTAGTPDDIYLRGTYTLTIAGSNDLVMAATSNITLPGATLSADPMLAPLANNGGPTLTMGLYAGSPASGTGSNPNAYTNDQRGTGFPRTVGGLTDIGAFQGTVAAPAPKIPAPTLSTWALGLLAGLLALFGWRRRRTE